MEHSHNFHPRPLEGLVFRHYQGEVDLPAMLDVFLSTKIEEHEPAVESLVDMDNKYRHLAHCDPYQDVLIAEVNGLMVAYCRVNWWQLEFSGDRIYFMKWYIRPEWYGPGLEKAFLTGSQERLRKVILQQAGTLSTVAALDTEAEAGTAPFSGVRLFEANASNLQPELILLLEEDGFRAVRWGSKMTCSDLDHIVDAPMPAGLTVRPVKPEQYRQIWDAMLDAFHQDPGYARPTDDDYARWQLSASFQPDLWQVAWDGSQVVGMVLNYITHGITAVQQSIAWTEDICVRRPWRRRWLAMALLARSMRMFHVMGFTQTSLGVDLNHPEGACQFYESMGYQIVHLFTIYRKPVDL